LLLLLVSNGTLFVCSSCPSADKPVLAASCCCGGRCRASALAIKQVLDVPLLLLLLLLRGGTIHTMLCTAAVCADHLSSWLPLLLSTSTQLPSAQPASTCNTASGAAQHSVAMHVQMDHLQLL
jgi:hypothetical protein